MRIRYRFVYEWTRARSTKLASLGIKVAPPAPQEGELAVSYVVEGSPEWPEACELIRLWDALVSVTTEFTPAEVDAASQCALQLVHASGYPQPDDVVAYREQTYDLSEHCTECGEGAVQSSPFRVKKTIKWGRNAFLKLNWVEEACFMQTSVWEAHLSGFGIAALPVEDPKGNKLDDIVQLDLGPAVPLSMGDTPGIRCERCSRERYPWHDRGFFPAPISPPDVPLFRSTQRFGVPRQSMNAMIVSAAVVRAIKRAGLRGAELWPCMPSD